MSLEMITAKRGRKPDPQRDAEILEVALDVLAEHGYEGMTLDLVAARARAGKGTLYRRWPSKETLVLEAVAQMKRRQVDSENLPDTGSLRGDLIALFKPQSVEEAARRLKIMAGLAAMVSVNAEIAEAVNRVMVEPWTNAHYALMKRAVSRGEVAKTADIKTVSRLLPSMAAYRALIAREAFDRKFLLTMLDGAVLPALGITNRK